MVCDSGAERLPFGAVVVMRTAETKHDMLSTYMYISKPGFVYSVLDDEPCHTFGTMQIRDTARDDDGAALLADLLRGGAVALLWATEAGSTAVLLRRSS